MIKKFLNKNPLIQLSLLITILSNINIIISQEVKTELSEKEAMMNPFKKSLSELEDECINENIKNFDFLNPKSKLIQNPNQCLNKSSQCCYVEINYKYGDQLISNNYCALLTGDMEERTQQISGTLTDQSRYYADFTYNKYPQLTHIGNNLDYVYYADFKCQQPVSEKEYYSYAFDNCALKNEDGTCRIVNDKIYAQAYTSLLYEKYMNMECNYREADGSCMGYEKDKGKDPNSNRTYSEIVCPKRDEKGDCYSLKDAPNYNISAVQPLFDQMEKYLTVLDDISYEDYLRMQEEERINKIKSMNQYSENFYKKCEKIEPARVRIVCPETYINSSYISLSRMFVIFVFLVLFG